MKSTGYSGEPSDEIRARLSRLAGRPLTEVELEESVGNLRAFFVLLRRWRADQTDPVRLTSAEPDVSQT